MIQNTLMSEVKSIPIDILRNFIVEIYLQVSAARREEREPLDHGLGGHARARHSCRVWI